MTEYNNPTPVAIGLIRCGTGILAIERLLTPIGGWALPGGFINEGETAEIAVAREFEEETRFILPAELWSPIATRITARNQLLIFLKCSKSLLPEALLEFIPTSEVSALKIVSPNETLCFPFHTEILHKSDYFFS